MSRVPWDPGTGDIRTKNATYACNRDPETCATVTCMFANLKNFSLASLWFNNFFKINPK
jgi:hypothetical protein